MDVLNQIPDSYGNDETTFEKREKKPLDVPLDEIAKDLLSFLNKLPSLSGAKKEIEKKYEIKKEDGDCWPADDIKRAWGETQRMDIKSSRRRYWAHVIIFQMLKRFKKDHNDTTNCETRSGMKENSEDTSSQCKAELETAGAAGGDEQMLGEGRKLSKASRPTESDSGVASGSPLSASSTDVPPSPAEVNPVTSSSNSETRNAGLLNEDEDTDNDNDQRKDVDDYELYVEGIYDPENDCLWSTDDMNQACGKAERIKGNSEDRSTQDSDELKTETAAEGVKQVSGGKDPESNYYGQTNIGRHGGTGTQSSSGSQDTAKDVGAVTNQPGAVSAAPNDETSMDIVGEYNYICIPLSKFSSTSTTESPDANTNTDTHLDYTYQLIDQSPSNTQCIIRTKESYVMLYDTDTKNAKWVYEILNKSTVPYCYKKQSFKKDNTIDDDKQALESTNGFKDKDKDYDRGHLAAAANHMWCQEAYKDTYLISNMTPQMSNINNGIWKTLEFYCRSLIDKVRNVHVYTGPLYQNNDEGSTMNGKAVPTHYFKVVIMEDENGKAKVECYVVENKKKKSETTDNPTKKREKIYLRDYSSTIKKIETMSGLTFTHKGDNNRRIKKKTLTCTGENESKRATIVVNIST